MPKVLHEICGLPMVLWPVRAAQAAGAERIVVVDSPERPLAEVLPDGVQLAVQPRPNGTGGAARAGMALLAVRVAGSGRAGRDPHRRRPARSARRRSAS